MDKDFRGKIKNATFSFSLFGFGLFKLGILSFNSNKIITTSGGSALILDNENRIKKARF